MCGINLIVAKDSGIIENALTQMQQSLGNRGPDNQGQIIRQWSESTIGIGATRLQIVDQNSSSDQPFHSPDRNFTLLFNGEIYNYQDLKNKLLKRSISFTTASDTEVLLYWLMQYGATGINELDGMYSLIFINHQNEEWFAARDPMGIKPLHFFEGSSKVIYSSTSKSLIDSGVIPKELNEEAIPQYLSFGYVHQPETLYKGVRQLKPGEIRVYKGSTLVSSDIRKMPPTRRASLQEVLTDAIALQVVNQSPGLMLSGGIDSTLILALIGRELGNQHISGYTLYYTNHGKIIESDDFNFAKKACDLYGGTHVPVQVSETVLQRFPEYLRSIDQPVGDSGGFANWLVAEHASKHGRVLLNGAGADELFAGYNRHVAYRFYLKNRSKWWFSLLKAGKYAPVSGKGLNHLRKFSRAIDPSPAKTFQNMLTFDEFPYHNPDPGAWPANQALEMALQNDQTHYLVDDVLAITDSSSMAHGVEVRVPFLTNEVVAWAQGKTAEQHLSGGTKTFLKELLTELGGKAFVGRKKTGFGLPTNYWLGLKENQNLWSFLDSDSYLFYFVDRKKIVELLEAHKKGRQNNSLLLWSLLILQGWLDREFN